MYYSAIERETIINMNDAEQVAYIESYQQTWIRKILRAKEKAIANGRPDDVVITKHTDVMIEAIVPKKYIKVSPPRFVSDERREQMREVARRRFAQASGKNIDDISDEEIDEEDELFEEDE